VASVASGVAGASGQEAFTARHVAVSWDLQLSAVHAFTNRSEMRPVPIRHAFGFGRSDDGVANIARELAFTAETVMVRTPLGSVFQHLQFLAVNHFAYSFASREPSIFLAYSQASSIELVTFVTGDSTCGVVVVFIGAGHCSMCRGIKFHTCEQVTNRLCSTPLPIGLADSLGVSAEQIVSGVAS
jgi:hypothetical protein